MPEGLVPKPHFLSTVIRLSLSVNNACNHVCCWSCFVSLMLLLLIIILVMMKTVSIRLNKIFIQYYCSVWPVNIMGPSSGLRWFALFCIINYLVIFYYSVSGGRNELLVSNFTLSVKYILNLLTIYILLSIQLLFPWNWLLAGDESVLLLLF